MSAKFRISIIVLIATTRVDRKGKQFHAAPPV